MHIKYNFSSEDCEKWFVDPLRNPVSTRKIRPDAKHGVSRQLEAQCEQHVKVKAKVVPKKKTQASKYEFTDQDCETWKKDPKHNPKTNRKIRLDAKYGLIQHLQNSCTEHAKASEATPNASISIANASPVNPPSCNIQPLKELFGLQDVDITVDELAIKIKEHIEHKPKEEKQSKIIDEAVATIQKLTGSTATELPILLDNLSKVYSKQYDIIQQTQKVLKTDLNLKGDDIVQLLQELKAYIQQLHKEHEAKPVQSKEKTCSVDVYDLKAEISRILQVAVYAKMCLFKYVASIIGEPLPNNVPCDVEGITRQINTFKMLPQPSQEVYKELYRSTYESLKAFKEQLETFSNFECDTIKQAKLQVAKLNQDIKDTTDKISNLFEDLYGSVRVFVRLRKLIPTLDDVKAASLYKIDVKDSTTISVKCNPATDYYGFNPTEFFGVFDETYDNIDIYTGKSAEGVFKINNLNVELQKNITDVKPWALYKTFKQLEQGYSICLFAYGISGSGKTTGFLGMDGRPGLVHYGLTNLEGIASIELYQAFELYYAYVSPNEKRVQSKIILLHDSTKQFKNMVAPFGISATDIDYETVSFSKAKVSTRTEINNYIQNITTECQTNMRNAGRIKKTPLNDNSSRSHLFLIFKLEFNNGTSSLFTLSDQAGFENAYSMHDRIFADKYSLPFLLKMFDSNGIFKGEHKNVSINQIINATEHGITNGNELLTRKSEGKLFFASSAKIEDTIAKNVQILYEGVHILESLLHMRYFFNKRNGINVESMFQMQEMVMGNLQYNVNRVFRLPQYEDVTSPFFKMSKTNNCLMVPILNYLDNMSKDKGKLTKFVMFVNLRKDKCVESIQALEFAKRVSATK